MSFSFILNITILSYHPQVIKMGEKHKGHVHVMLCVIYCTQILICLQDLPLECVCKKLLKNIPFLWEKLCEVPLPSHLSNQACISRTMEYYVVGHAYPEPGMSSKQASSTMSSSADNQGIAHQIATPSIVFKGPVHRTEKRPKTELDQQLQLHAFQTTQPDRFKPVAHVILLKNAHILSPFWGETDQNCMSYGQNNMFWQNPTLCDIT